MAYGRLVTTPIAVWAVAVVLSRLPVVMAPLAFIFSAHRTPGGYAAGAAMAAVYTVAEAAGAPLLGVRLRTRGFQRELSVGLAVSASAFACLVVLPSLPLGFSLVLAGVAGASAAAAPGGLRTMVTRMVSEADVRSALSLESVLNMAVWALSPALVAMVALQVSPTVPFIVAATAALLAAAMLYLIPGVRRRTTASSDAQSPGLMRTLGHTWSIYLTSAAAMYLLATAELTLPALLEQRGYPLGYAGPILTAFAVASIVGGVIYGLRRWPGDVRRHSLLLLLLVTSLVFAVAGVPYLAVMISGLLLAGVFQAAVLIARNLSLRYALPSPLHPAGYSLLYAGSGIGYGISAAVTGVVITLTTPAVAMGIGAGITLVLTLVTAGSSIHPARMDPSYEELQAPENHPRCRD